MASRGSHVLGRQAIARSVPCSSRSRSYVPEEESVRRQLHRGAEFALMNQMVADTGIGHKQVR